MKAVPDLAVIAHIPPPSLCMRSRCSYRRSHSAHTRCGDPVIANDRTRATAPDRAAQARHRRSGGNFGRRWFIRAKFSRSPFSCRAVDSTATALGGAVPKSEELRSIICVVDAIACAPVSTCPPYRHKFIKPHASTATVYA